MLDDPERSRCLRRPERREQPAHRPQLLDRAPALPACLDVRPLHRRARRRQRAIGECGQILRPEVRSALARPAQAPPQTLHIHVTPAAPSAAYAEPVSCITTLPGSRLFPTRPAAGAASLA